MTARQAAGSTAVRRTATAAVAGAVVTAAVVALPSVQFAYRSQDGRLVIETAVAMIAALGAVLLYGRFRRSGALQELLLVHAFGLLGVTALFFVALPIVAGATAGGAVPTWGALVVRVVGAALLLAAALVPGRRVDARVHPLRVLVVLVCLAALAVAVQVLASALPAAVTTQLSPEESGRPRMEGHPVVLGTQALNALLYCGAALAFTLQARRTGDELIGWVAVAAALGAWARVHYLLFPSLYSEWLYTGDLLRLASYVALLVGALREIGSYWRAQSEAAVFAERRRLARDLHDGTVQELGHIQRLAGRPGMDPAVAAEVRATALRALDEARRAIAALAAPADEATGVAVRRAVGEMGDRYGVAVVLRDELGEERLPPDSREALVRIAREAVSNAARHAHPSVVTVTLQPGRMVVEDDGAGFDASTAPTGRDGHFGLVGMGDRAQGMGGHLEVDSAPGRGTRVVVSW